jgi:acetyl-CoA carboxylase carboxyl transferase subunit alpha
LDALTHEKQIQEILQALESMQRQSRDTSSLQIEISKLEQRLEQLREVAYSRLSPWERVQISRHPQRPHTVDYIENICEHFRELCGDRTYRDDRAVIGGLATIGDVRCVIIGQEKGNDTTSRVTHNFGMPHPEGYRKALRLMQLAAKFSLPVVSLIDTPGAYPGLEAEERGQGRAIALNLLEMARLTTPIIVVIIGEASSGGALGMAAGDVVGMLEHSYYTVISPEGCASILWKDAVKKDQAAGALKLNAENLLEYGIIDHVIKEPVGGAHRDPVATYAAVKKFIVEQCLCRQNQPTDLLLQQRYLKYRRMGAHTFQADV